MPRASASRMSSQSSSRGVRARRAGCREEETAVGGNRIGQALRDFGGRELRSGTSIVSGRAFPERSAPDRRARSCFRSGGERAIEVDGRLCEPLAEARRLQHRFAVLIDVAAAVEDEPVIGADQIDVGDRALVVRGAGGDQLPPGLDDAEPETARRRGSSRVRRPHRPGASSDHRGSRCPRKPRPPSSRNRSGRA